MYALIVLAFSVPVIGSILMFAGAWHPAVASRSRMIWKVVYELIALAALYFVLLRQNRRFSSIGFSSAPSFVDFGHSVVLFFGSYFASAVVYGLAVTTYVQSTGHSPAIWDRYSDVLGDPSSIVALFFVLLNPFYEELLVRGFLITEVTEIASPIVAIVASVALQTSYHLYQGIPSAVALSASFFVLSVYFCRTRRLIPVILCHLYMDIFCLLMYIRTAHSLS